MLKMLKPPPGFEKKGGIYTPSHHSVADWDFELGTLYRSLSAETFVSSPSSLKFYATGTTYRRDTVLCRLADTLCIAQGELRTWLRYNGFYQRVPCFRNQAPLGTATWDNCYFVQIISDKWTLTRYIGGTGPTLAETACSSVNNVWEHWRCVFWDGNNPEYQEALCVELYKEIGGEWVKQGATLYDTTSQWETSEINRIGFHMTFRDAKAQFIDDTEIWGPVV